MELPCSGSHQSKRQQIAAAFKVIDKQSTGQIRSEVFDAVLKLACPTVRYEELEGTLVTEGVITHGHVKYNNFVSWLFDIDRQCTPILVQALSPTSQHQKHHRGSLLRGLRSAINLGSESLDADSNDIASIRHTAEDHLFKLGPAAPETLASASALADALRIWGRLTEAESVCRQCLEACEERDRLMKEPQSDSITPTLSLAAVLAESGRLGDAELELQRAVELARLKCGLRHPMTLRVAGDLYIVHYRLGRLREAERGLREVLAAQQERLGADHHQTIATASNLAVIVQELGRPAAEAEPLARRCASAAEERYGGLAHPESCSSACNLSSILRATGRLQEALELSRRIVAAFEASPSQYAGHPSCVLALMSLADALRVQQGEDYKREAEAVYARALEKQDAIWGADSPRRVGLMVNLSSLCSELGRLEESEALLRRALELATRTPPSPSSPSSPQHSQACPSSAYLSCLSNLASVCRRQNKLEEAEELARRALEAKERIQGATHQSTLLAANNLGNILAQLGRPREAEPLLRRAAEGLRLRLGEEDPRSQGASQNLQVLLQHLEREQQTAVNAKNLGKPYWSVPVILLPPFAIHFASSKACQELPSPLALKVAAAAFHMKLLLAVPFFVVSKNTLRWYSGIRAVLHFLCSHQLHRHNECVALWTNSFGLLGYAAVAAMADCIAEHDPRPATSQ
eukprot:CAMPEP_0206541478 /NCGR_PEP_ID=MMETSP0325_2-20121206/9634_1 /ASSEMBLY_ACC=CAM_ASM_000347 /TAXON_ID=2866 /ORGANISM="Crypthecodinium cohnii, Strain Seligo" /LENGTH=693 /DNA_ID=CAMNT_0054039419 /DNA_START=115 /DNA_END=2195 /DNA_ORIENTATION=-